jgi:hypothetical protein
MYFRFTDAKNGVKGCTSSVKYLLDSSIDPAGSLPVQKRKPVQLNGFDISNLFGMALPYGKIPSSA